MAAQYDTTSPYFTTEFSQFFLDVMTNRAIPRDPDDKLFTIVQTYQYRPDMLALDLYNNSGLWWVFYQRNPNALTAPPWDFEAGVQIYLPKIATLRSVLGF
jgi:hypothetical protein